MNEQKPTVIRRASMMMIFSQVAVAALVIGIIHLVIQPASPLTALAAGVMLYIVYSYGSRMVLTASHRRGVRLIRQKQWKSALHAFEQSYAFFSKYPWLDEYRFITLLTPTAISYREMALNNMGYALVQAGDNRRAKQYYTRLLEQFPQTVLADSARRVLAAIEKK